MATQEEILKLAIQSSGEEGAKRLAAALNQIRVAAENGGPEAKQLVDELGRLSDVSSSIASITRLKASLQETGDNLFLARRRVKELEDELALTPEPTARLERALAKARAEVAKLAVDQNRQTASLARAQNTIKAAGYDLGQLARAEADVRDRSAQATAEANKLAASLRSSGQAAKSSAGIFSGLRGIVAGLFAGLSAQGAIEGVKKVAELGDVAERTQKQLGRLYGSQAAGQKAFAALNKFANDNALAFDGTLTSAVKLKSFGIDPLAGSLQSLVDENAAMGGSQERLEGTILAVGQAWAKQKLQGEEILQLVERGVPVWDLLAKVTGKSVLELQKLSEAGKLGRVEIAGLVKEIGRVNFGAAAANANTLSGLLTQLQGRVRAFFTDVSNKGPLEFFKGQLRDLIRQVDELARSGDLAKWARDVGGAIVSATSAVVNGTKFIAEHAAAILFLAKAYAAVKIGNFLVDLATMATNAGTATKGITSLGGALARLPAGVQVAIALVGLDLAVKGAKALGDEIGKNLPVTRQWEERAKALNAETRASADRYLAATASLEKYRNVQVKSEAAVALLTSAERERYEQGLAGLLTYLRTQETYYSTLQKIGQLNDEGEQHLTNIRARVAQVEAAFKVLNNTAAGTVDVISKQLTDAGRALEKQLKSVGNNAKGVGDALGEAFKTISTDSITTVGEIGVALSQVAKQSDSAAATVRAGLAAALRDLSGTDLLKFQSSSVAAFEVLKVSAKDTAAILDASLLVGLEKLNVAQEKFGLGISTSGAQAIAVFRALAENSRATAAQLEAAFVAALKLANSKEDISALGASLKVALAQGRIGIEGAERASAALRDRVREIAVITDPLGDSFARLGITSQRALDAARDSAKDAFNQIAAGAAKGAAAQADVQRAFNAWAAAARAAAADGAQANRDQAEAQIRAISIAFNLRDALKEVGAAGADAGQQTAQAANDAADALGNLKGAAEDAADGATSLTDSTNNASSSMAMARASASSLEFSLNGVSEAFARASTSAQGLDRIEFGKLADQRKRYDEALKATNDQIQALEDEANGVTALRNEYNLLDAENARTLAQQQNRLNSLRKQRQETDKQAKDERQSQGEPSSQGGGAGGVWRGGLDVNVRFPDGVTTKAVLDNLDEEDRRKLANVITPHIVTALSRAARNAGFGGH